MSHINSAKELKCPKNHYEIALVLDNKNPDISNNKSEKNIE